MKRNQEFKRPVNENCDFSGLSGFSQEYFSGKKEEKFMIQSITFAILVLAATIYILLEDSPSYCSDYLLIGKTYDRCLTDRKNIGFNPNKPSR